MKKIRNSITAKFVLLTLISVIPVVLLLVYINYRASSAILLSQAKEHAQLVVNNAIEKMELITRPIEKVPQSVAKELPHSPDKMVQLLKVTIGTNSDIFGMAAAFEPHAFNSRLEAYCPYVYKKNGKIQVTRLDTAAYNYLESPWYAVPKKLSQPVWSEPYFDKGGGNVLMSTYSFPIFRNKQFIGVLTADFSLKHLNSIVSGIHVLRNGYAVLLSRKGLFLSTPDKSLIGKTDVAAFAREIGSQSIKKVSAAILEGKTGFMRYRKNGEAYHLYFRPIPTTGWIIAVVFPENELFAPLHNLTKTTILPAFLGILFIVLIISIISRKATGRVTKLSEIAEIISTGNFNTDIPADPSGDELGKLNKTFRYMQNSLRHYIEDLKTATAKEQRIESELNIAREIQMGILPRISDPLPKEKNIDLYAMIEPAREVGGDLYDFFFVDPTHFCFLVGDVSGKGVPAALFMAVTKTLIKAIASTGKATDETLKIVNNELTANNSNCMFVTVFIGILNIRTGEIHFTNAGHNPPVHIGTRSVSFVQSQFQPAIGAFPDAAYGTGQLKLSPGESLFLYTDGVNEAFNTKGEQYGNERLVAALKSSTGQNSAEIVRVVFKDVSSFVNGAEQSDDITMLNIRYTG